MGVHDGAEYAPDTVDDGYFAGANAHRQIKDKISQEYDRLNKTIDIVPDRQLRIDAQSTIPNQKTRADFIADTANIPYGKQHTKIYDDIFDPRKILEREANQAKQAMIKRAAVEQNPGVFANVDKANSKFMTMVDAAQSPEAVHGVFPASEYLKAVKNKSTPVQVATETAFDQEVAAAAANVMKQGINPNGVPGFAYLNNIGSELAGVAVNARHAPGIEQVVDAATSFRDAGTPASNIFAAEINRLINEPEKTTQKKAQIAEASFKKQLEMNY